MRRGRWATWLTVLLVALGGGAATAGQRTGETAPRVERVVRAHVTTERIVIDGRLDEPAWLLAEAAEKFIQYEPRSGAPVVDGTEVRFLYDADNLYVGARCWDQFPDRMKVTELKEDFTGAESDSLTIFLDTLHDKLTGFSFAVNPAGARRDAQSWADGDQRNEDWDGVWDVKVTVDDKGWLAEFRIPFKTLRFSKAESQDWGLNVYRRTRRSNEESLWSPIPRRYRFRRASLAGTLTGLEGIRQGRNLKVKPFISGRMDELTASGRSTDADAGVDIKYGVTPSMTLDGTYRTDFAQVEADQQQVNLTRFNLLFPEKREFFLENSGVFAVAGGGGPSGEGAANIIPFFSRRIGLSSSGTPIPITAGTRLSGKVGSYDVGVLGMRTSKTDALRANDFLVGRLRRTIRGQSTIGAIVTSRTSSLSGDYGRMYGADTFLRFDKLEVTSYILKTDTPDRQGRDGAHLLSVGWRGDDVTATGLYEDVQPNFRPDVGFVRRSDMGHYSGDLQWRPRPRPGIYLRNYLTGATADYYTNDDGLLETRESSVYAGMAFQDQSQFRVTGTRTFDRLTAPFAIRPTVTLPVGDYTYQRYGVTYNSDRSQPLAGSVNASAGEFWDGDSVAVSGTLELRPSYHFNMELNLNRTHANLPSGDFTTTIVGARILWAFTSKAFLNSFLQYNATTNQFSANTRFNIIHRPLSDLYVVYNEQRDTNSGNLVARGVVLKLTNLFDF